MIRIADLRGRSYSAAMSHSFIISPLMQALALLQAEDQSLDALASHVGWSPAYLQRRFTAVFGLSPKEFALHRKHQGLKHGLRRPRSNVTHAILDAGYGSPSRVYEHTAKLGMTPQAYARGGEGLTIAWTILEAGTLGNALVAATEHGICAVLLESEHGSLLDALEQEFPHATLSMCEDGAHAYLKPRLDAVAEQLAGMSTEVPVHLMGTAFEVRVWKALLTVPKGETRSYGELAEAMGEPSSTRAVASACGRNKVGVVVPCHRIVRSDGSLGGYRWGLPTKQTLLDRERALFRASLERHGQLQEGPGKLMPGVTHVVEEVDGEPRLQRKRFAAIR